MTIQTNSACINLMVRKCIMPTCSVFYYQLCQLCLNVANADTGLLLERFKVFSSARFGGIF